MLLYSAGGSLVNRDRDFESGMGSTTIVCKGNLTDLRRILYLSLAKGNPK
jgi:hypothetical protein